MQAGSSRRSIIRIALAGALLAALVLRVSCSLLPNEEEEPTPAIAPPVKTEKSTYVVRRGQIEEKVSLRAILSPARQADLFYKYGGRVKAVYITAGQQVEAGQVLAELYAEEEAYQAAQARIRLERAELVLADAKYQAQFNSAPSLQNEIRRCQLDVESARLDVERYGAQVADAQLVAPFAGQIMRVDVKPGDAVQSYTPVIQIADPSALLVEADVSDSDLVKLGVGMKARLEFGDLPGATAGTVVELPDPKALAMAPVNQPKRIKVQPEKLGAGARMSLVGKVHVILQEKNDVLLLENAAIRHFANRTYVLKREPRVEQDIVLGIEGDQVSEVVRGLKEGDILIGR